MLLGLTVVPRLGDLAVPDRKRDPHRTDLGEHNHQQGKQQ